MPKVANRLPAHVVAKKKEGDIEAQGPVFQEFREREVQSSKEESKESGKKYEGELSGRGPRNS